MTDDELKKKGGRTATAKTNPAELPAILPEVDARIVAAQDQALSAGETDEVFAAGVDVGRLEAMDFVATIATSAMLSIYENVKKSKAWRYLRHPQSGDGRHFESLEEFCEVKLGRSYRRVRELAANRNLIGQEAFEQAERIGLRQVDYNAIKALPAPDQELVRRAVEESQSRDEVLSLLQELAARNGREMQALAQRADDAQANLLAQQELLDKKNQRIDKLEREAKRIARLPAEEALADTKKEAADILAEALGVIQGNFRQALIALQGESADVFAAGLVGQIAATLAALREEFNLPDVSEAGSAFDEGASAAIREGLAAARAQAEAGMQ